MKEAAGEANLTVIAILLIGVVAAIATPLITTMVRNSARKSCCQNVGGVMTGNTCTDAITDVEIPVANYWNSDENTCAE